MRIALISDIHFGRMATSREFSIDGEALDLGEIQNARPLLDGAIELYKGEKPDYLVVAGDLTSTGSPLEFKYCFQLLSHVAREIGVEDGKILFCMGNHDVDWRITKIIEDYPKEKYRENDYIFLQSFYQKYATSVSRDTIVNTDLKHASFAEEWHKPFSGTIEDENCIFFLLNSSHLSAHDQELKHGSLTSEQLQWFSKEAEKHRNSNKHKIVILHHHPYAYENLLPSLDASLLEEGGELTNICGQNGIELVIHGHKHQPLAYTEYLTGWRNPVSYVCAGSISVNVTERQQVIPNTLHCIEFEPKSIIKLTSYSYTPEDGWFATKYSKATPIDHIMYLGKNPNMDSIRETLGGLIHGKKYTFEDLFAANSEIRFITRHLLVKLIQESHPGYELYQKENDSFIIYGEGD